MYLILGHLSQPKMELTVGEGGWTNSSEQKVEKPGKGAEGEPARRKQKSGDSVGGTCGSRAELAAPTKLTLSRPSAALLSNVHRAIAGKSLLILIGGTHL